MLALLVALLTASPAPQASGDAFGTHWYDGRAEVNGYRWRGSRYGEPREGEAVAIFVTETIGAKDHVKVDDPSEHSGDVLTVLKLNLVRDFQTGLYDYDTMTTVFASVDDFAPVKQSFSSTEWCGNVYEELDVRSKELAFDIRSYFQGETARDSLASRRDGIVGDQLLVWLRGLRGEPLAPGETRRLPYVADAFERRLRHTEIGWGELTVTRRAQPVETEVPAGKFRAIVYDLAASDGRTGVVRIGAEAPRLLLGWEWRRGDEVLDSGVLTGGERMKYWELHGTGDVGVRQRIGLPELAPTGSR